MPPFFVQLALADLAAQCEIALSAMSIEQMGVSGDESAGSASFSTGRRQQCR